MRKVMVLEDESSIRSFIVINLRRAGYEVIEAETGEEALEKLKEFRIVPSMLQPTTAIASAFDAPTESMTSIMPLLYQAGYFTIKGHDPVTGLYTLDFPNNEIRIGLMESLLPNYVQTDSYKGTTTVALGEGLLSERFL